MDSTSEDKPAKHICVGILAHVDAGKTTLAESLLFLSGKIRNPGRVDHGDAYLDTYELERSRGITIFSKQAELAVYGKDLTILDTPGHVDFSAEMERTLQVLDYAILVVSGADGVQGSVETLWKLLKRYRVPAFLFVNKMDQQGCDRGRLLEELQDRLSGNCVDFSASHKWMELAEAGEKDVPEEGQAFLESLALCDEDAMEEYLEHGRMRRESVIRLIDQRKLYPCYFGSALKMQGIEALMRGISEYMAYPEYPSEFGARVFKISRDERGTRLAHMKITGGSLKVKSVLSGKDGSLEEKADQIRIYSGSGYELRQNVSAGTICAVTGLGTVCAGEGLGWEQDNMPPALVPVLNYRLRFPEEIPPHVMMEKLRQLEEEEPLLRVVWKEAVSEIHVQLMGLVQLEVVKSLIQERFGVAVEFDTGSIVYKETLTSPVEGVGHYEPLRHYAEVHLLMEPAEPGSGLQFESVCSEDDLDKNWQRLILTHLEERQHRGVLTGSEITDLKITLVGGRAHQKHTEGGDFRQATYRAVRQGLKMGESQLLEPMYAFRLEVPQELVGRAMTDIQRMCGSFEGPETVGDMAVLTGQVPVASMQEYQIEVTSYTKGRGKLFCSPNGYAPCHNSEEVIEAIGYDSERDLEHPTSSVFCAHGAGFVVPWDQVYGYMHMEGVLAGKNGKSAQPGDLGHAGADGEAKMRSFGQGKWNPGIAGGYTGDAVDKELEAIFQRTYGEGKQQRRGWGKTVVRADSGGIEKTVETVGKGIPGAGAEGKRQQPSEPEYLLVDGYNIIFGWEDLNELAKINVEAARTKLMDILCNYQGFKKNVVILVFDAYKVEGNPGTTLSYHNIHVVFTKEAETADQYIEKVTHQIGRKRRVTVATSDGLEQMIILGQGAHRISAKGLREEIEAISGEIRQELSRQGTGGSKNYLFARLPEELAEEMENIRLGKGEGQE